MNTPSRTRVNGDASAGLAVSGGGATTDASQTTADAAAAPAPAAALVAAAKAPQRPEPALTAPDEHPAIPRDKHHGKGGMYALVNGKRVKADDEGNPLPDDQQAD